MANRIRELREARGWSLDDLADRVGGTSKQQMHKLELGKRPLTQDWMERIAKALGVNAWDLLPGIPELNERRLRMMRRLDKMSADRQSEVEEAILRIVGEPDP